MKQKFFFPLNYDYSSKFLGIIEYKLLTPLIIYGTIIFLTLKQTSFDFFTNLGIFIILVLPPILILNSTVHNEPFYTFILAITHHILSSKIYLYKRVIWCGINLSCNYPLYILWPRMLKNLCVPPHLI